MLIFAALLMQPDSILNRGLIAQDVPAYLTSWEQPWYSTMTTMAASYCSRHATPTCQEASNASIIEALNTRRGLRRRFADDGLIDRLLHYSCEAELAAAAENGLAPFTTCAQRAFYLPTAAAMQRIGERRQGVTMLGYYRLRTGMDREVVEYILGPNYDQSASAGSLETDVWRSPRGSIVVTFENDKLVAQAQSIR